MMRGMSRWFILVTVGMCGWSISCDPRKPQAIPERDGLALAIVYDTSGSMLDPVPNASGDKEPKFLIARRAVKSILDQLTVYINDAAPNAPREVQAELIVLDGSRARTVLDMEPFQAAPFQKWIDSFSKPGGGTPLGKAIRQASDDVRSAPLTRKHILVLTDGINTEGPAPESLLPAILAEAQAGGDTLHLHFVAFDVDAKVFNPVKNLGATVVGAQDEIQLKDQLEFILQKKILLENEEPPLK